MGTPRVAVSAQRPVDADAPWPSQVSTRLDNIETTLAYLAEISEGHGAQLDHNSVERAAVSNNLRELRGQLAQEAGAQETLTSTALRRELGGILLALVGTVVSSIPDLIP